MTGGRLIARVDILYGNTQYYAGDELPDDIPAELAETWIGCRSAEFIQEPAEEPERKQPKPSIPVRSVSPEQSIPPDMRERKLLPGSH